MRLLIDVSVVRKGKRFEDLVLGYFSFRGRKWEGINKKGWKWFFSDIGWELGVREKFWILNEENGSNWFSYDVELDSMRIENLFLDLIVWRLLVIFTKSCFSELVEMKVVLGNFSIEWEERNWR